MRREEIRDICNERLSGWVQRAVQIHATPMLLITVGHDHNSGELHVFVPEDTPTDLIRAALEFALKGLPEDA